MKEFDKIFMSWRKGYGHRQHIVGLLQQIPAGQFTFSYNREGIEQAQKDGFTSYTDFPDTSISYNGSVLDVFAQRLIKSERPDIQSFYDFWEIEAQHKEDKFYLLGHTQDLLPTDNFEFLAGYKLVPGLHFLTELAGLSVQKLPATILKEGDELTFELEKINAHVSDAVKVLKGNTAIGYIKKIHCRVFHQSGSEKLKLFVKAIDKNGIIKRVFIKVEL